jgi:ComF family protein
MRRISGVRLAANGLVAALFAPVCAVCNTVLDEPLSGCVCERCWMSILPITPPLCDSCGDPLPRPVNLCASCTGRGRIIQRARAVGEYEGALRHIVHALKYNGRRSLARPLAARMRASGSALIENADCAVAVPLHWRREYQRGFNQAHDLARLLGLPMRTPLTRLRHTQPQVELAAHHRHENVRGAFGLRGSVLRRQQSVEGLKVLLVDDVSTTGATLDACAALLKTAGASEVYALTAARVTATRGSGTNPHPDPLR